MNLAQGQAAHKGECSIKMVRGKKRKCMVSPIAQVVENGTGYRVHHCLNGLAFLKRANRNNLCNCGLDGHGASELQCREYNPAGDADGIAQTFTTRDTP